MSCEAPLPPAEALEGPETSFLMTFLHPVPREGVRTLT